MSELLTVRDIAAISLVWFSIGYYVAWRRWSWWLGLGLVGLAVLSTRWRG